MNKKSNKRIKLLSEAEINDIYGLPQFNESEHLHYFSLTQQEESILNQLSFLHSKVHFILQLGFFKAKQRLFKFTFQQILSDVDYVMKAYFPYQTTPKKLPSRNSIAKNRVLSQIL